MVSYIPPKLAERMVWNWRTEEKKALGPGKHPGEGPTSSGGTFMPPPVYIQTG